MNRRELLLGGIALAGASVIGNTFAAEHKHDHMHMTAANTSLNSATADCIQKGQACLSHCLILLGDGDKSMAECAKSVNQMLALCGTLQSLSNQNSKLLARTAAIAMDACNQCADACRKHADKHAECKACGESCVACAKECKKIAA